MSCHDFSPFDPSPVSVEAQSGIALAETDARETFTFFRSRHIQLARSVQASCFVWLVALETVPFKRDIDSEVQRVSSHPLS
jgi:hypothetical protein